MDNFNRRPVRRPAQSASGARVPSGQPNRQPSTPQRKQPKRSESRWFRAILMVIATIAACIFFAIFILSSANDLFGLNQDNRQIEVAIPNNADLSQISSILNESGVIEQPLTFRIYASLKKDEAYHPGKYLLNSNMGYDEILIALRTGANQKETVTLTFIESWSAYQIATHLEEKKVCKADEFLACLETTDFGYSFMDELPESALRFRRLEGYLFPDTYEFYVPETAESVARKFLRNFESRMTQSLRNRMMDMNLTLDETITLASVIQKEAGNKDDMKRVSSVFHNRLALPEVYPRLQSDVTKIYVNTYIVPFQDLRDQAMYDAYNTYIREGIPVGPICNPGMTAIEAALYPAETDYYFFVTDVKEKFYYSETAQEHYKKVRIAAAVEGEGEIHGVDTE